ncbi:MAG: hypothetical protein ABIA04_05690 [Pseudomonadota bacterium]
MTKRLTWDQIRKKYPDQWVSLDDVEYDEKRNIISAMVFIANSELKIVTRKSKGVFFKNHLFEYTDSINPYAGLLKWGINAQPGK